MLRFVNVNVTTTQKTHLPSSQMLPYDPDQLHPALLVAPVVMETRHEEILQLPLGRRHFLPLDRGFDQVAQLLVFDARCTLLATAFTSIGTSTALACSDVTTVMAHFEGVKDAYLEAAPNMKPEQFPIWAGHLDRRPRRPRRVARACAGRGARSSSTR